MVNHKRTTLYVLTYNSPQNNEIICK